MTENSPSQAQHWAGPGRKAKRELWPAVTRPKRLEAQLSREVVINQQSVNRRRREGEGSFRAGKGTGTDTGKGL